jgi:ABC-type Na+ efflux pump permease subunit
MKNPLPRTIARREFLHTIRRKGFILTLILMPLYAVVSAMVGFLPTAMAKKSTETRLIGVVDPGGALGVRPGETVPMISGSRADSANAPATIWRAKFFPSFDEAKRAFEAGEVRTILRLEPDYLTTGKVAEYRRSGGIFTRRRLGPP